MKKVLGVGAALVDLLVSVDDEWILKAGSPKGGMTLVDFPKLRGLLASVGDLTRVPGGSACNTMVGLAKLGGNAEFLSKIGYDELGRVFSEHLETSGVGSLLRYSDEATGCVLSAVTPDAERTMFSYLGASDTLNAGDFSDSTFSGAGLVYLEGYRAFDGATFRTILELAKEAGAETAVDFGSFDVVNVCHALFEQLFAEGLIDLVFANEEEAFAYTGKQGSEALAELSKLARIAVVKLGSKGALVANGGEVTEVKVGAAKALDTTGAGDLWAAGFLYGYLSGWSMARAGELASATANEVIQIQGAQIPDAGYERVKKLLG